MQYFSRKYLRFIANGVYIICVTKNKPPQRAERELKMKCLNCKVEVEMESSPEPAHAGLGVVICPRCGLDHNAPTAPTAPKRRYVPPTEAQLVAAHKAHHSSSQRLHRWLINNSALYRALRWKMYWGWKTPLPKNV